MGQLIMHEQQELLQQRTPLVPTGVPDGVDEALRSIRYGRQTRQMQQRIGREDQTPMFPKGFGTPHAVLVETQLPLTVLIKRFCWPPLPGQGDDFGGTPVGPVRDQHDRASGQRLVLKAHHKSDPAPPLLASLDGPPVCGPSRRSAGVRRPG